MNDLFYSQCRVLIEDLARLAVGPAMPKHEEVATLKQRILDRIAAAQTNTEDLSRRHQELSRLYDIAVEESERWRAKYEMKRSQPRTLLLGLPVGGIELIDGIRLRVILDDDLGSDSWFLTTE